MRPALRQLPQEDGKNIDDPGGKLQLCWFMFANDKMITDVVGRRESETHNEVFLARNLPFPMTKWLVIAAGVHGPQHKEHDDGACLHTEACVQCSVQAVRLDLSGTLTANPMPFMMMTWRGSFLFVQTPPTETETLSRLSQRPALAQHATVWPCVTAAGCAPLQVLNVLAQDSTRNGLRASRRIRSKSVLTVPSRSSW